MRKTIIILATLFILMGVAFSSFAYEAEIYEKDGCVYIVGHLIEEERAEYDRIYEERMAEIDEIYFGQQAHELALAEIWARTAADNRAAREDYLEGLEK